MAASLTKCLFSRSRLLLHNSCCKSEPVLVHGLVSASLHTRKGIAPNFVHSWFKYKFKNSNKPVAFAFARLNSTSPVTTAGIATPLSTDGYIPPPPSVTSPQTLPSQPSTELFDSLNHLGEPTLSSLGLANWIPIPLPTGWHQFALETIHVNFGLPWAGSIILLTVMMRVALIPLAINSQKQMVAKANVNPGYTKLTEQYRKLSDDGDIRGACQVGQQVVEYQKKHGIDPNAGVLSNLPKTVFVQAPIFITCLWSLRQMVNHPVTSLSTGGFLWFPDLLATDALYGLPLMTSLALFGNLIVNAGPTLRRNPAALGLMTVAPFGVFYVIHDFATAVLVYWVTTNSFTFIQTSILKIPAVKTYFKIPTPIHHKISEFSKETETEKGFGSKISKVGKGLVENFRSVYNQAFGKNTLRASKKREQTNYRKAATGPIVETFSYNPKKIKKLQ